MKWLLGKWRNGDTEMIAWNHFVVSSVSNTMGFTARDLIKIVNLIVSNDPLTILPYIVYITNNYPFLWIFKPFHIDRPVSSFRAISHRIPCGMMGRIQLYRQSIKLTLKGSDQIVGASQNFQFFQHL